MNKTIVVTDSASDIPKELEEKHGIVILPFTITVDGKSYVERQDFTLDAFYEMLTSCQSIPTTAHITMMEFSDRFCQWDSEGYTDVLYIAINSGGSNTYNAAKMGAAQFHEARPKSALRIHIIDSRTYSMAYGWHVCEAARKLKNGGAIGDVVTYLHEQFACMEVILSVFTLRFIKKSGRISAAAAFAGELLGLRPIITMIDGITATAAKVRGDNNVMPGAIAHMKKRMCSGAKYWVGATDSENAKMLAKLCKNEIGYAPEGTFLLGAAVSTNTGPNAIGLVYQGALRA